ncbi:MAG: four helix bundle protein [Polaribacter sp.]|jgi:four helix bundle protein
MSFTDLLAFKKSFSLAMNIFETSKSFPKEEKYSLTDQIRRSSRSVSANISEAYRKRQYPKHFSSKLSDADADAENSETLTWLLFALKCNYVDQKLFDILSLENVEVGKLINYMMNNPAKFGVK